MKRVVQLTITEADFPETVHGFLARDGENSYMIITNKKDSKDQQAASFLHECLHLFHDDFNSDLSVDAIETERHQELPRLLELLINAQEGVNYDNKRY